MPAVPLAGLRDGGCHPRHPAGGARTSAWGLTWCPKGRPMQSTLDHPERDSCPPGPDLLRRPNRAHLLAHERAALEQILGGAGRGHGQTLVLRGESGFGKTTLLDHAASYASGFQVVRICGVESERDLSYAALH